MQFILYSWRMGKLVIIQCSLASKHQTGKTIRCLYMFTKSLNLAILNSSLAAPDLPASNGIKIISIGQELKVLNPLG